MILLDTNALVWLHRDDVALGRQARTWIDAAETVCFSAVSASELAIKKMLGRIELPGLDRFPQPFRDAGLRELPFTSAHAAGMLRFPELAHRDPFDRMILAQADTEHLQLLTSDRTLLSLGQTWILDART